MSLSTTYAFVNVDQLAEHKQERAALLIAATGLLGFTLGGQVSGNLSKDSSVHGVLVAVIVYLIAYAFLKNIRYGYPKSS